MKYEIMQECSQKWYRKRSWQPFRRSSLWRPMVHEGERIGTAVGPIMFLKKNRSTQ